MYLSPKVFCSRLVKTTVPSCFITYLFLSAKTLVAADVIPAESGQWHSQNSTGCKLIYQSPTQGVGTFTNSKLQGVSFYWDLPEKMKIPHALVEMEAAPPAWRSDLTPDYLGFVHAPAAQHLFELPAPQASQVLLALDKGVNIHFNLRAVKVLESQEDQSSSSAAASFLELQLTSNGFADDSKSFDQCAGLGFSKNANSTKQKQSDLDRVKAYVNSPQAVNPNVKKQSDLERIQSYVATSKADISSAGIKVKSEKLKPWKFSADPKKADWDLSVGPFACSLVQKIPEFGDAVFEHKAGSVENFRLVATENNLFAQGEAKIETLPPSWKTFQTPALIGKTQIRATNPSLSLDSEPLLLLAVQLTLGSQVMISGPADQDPKSGIAASNIMRVLLDSKNFKAKYKKFQTCGTELIQTTFAQVSRTQINFAEKFSDFSDSDKAKLANIARYANADSKVLSILVDAHTDNSGTPEENSQTAKKVAEAVALYLKEKGVSETKVTSRAHADKFPIGDNRTPDGRAKNRRVTIRLIDEQAREAAEKAVAEHKAAEAQKAALQQSSLPSHIAKKLDEIQKADSSEKPSDTDNANSSSGNKKVTAEEIRKLIEGLNAIDGQ